MRTYNEIWPELPYEKWKDACNTLLRWTQIVGKIRLSQSPWINHAWQSTLYVTERGLTTSVIHHKDVSFAVDLDFVSHELQFRRSNGETLRFPLKSESVADFYSRCMKHLEKAGVDLHIFAQPNELPDATPFAEDQMHHAYDPEAAHHFWRILLQADRLMKIFRSRFIGKVSPVHFFWGAMDVAVTRFSGRRAPEHPGGVPHLPDLITREAYSHEVSSCGFWPGSDAFPMAAFYSYAYPKPVGFENAQVPAGASYHSKLGEFILPYEVVRYSKFPDALVLDFFQKTYDAAADLGRWDREALEHSSYLEMLQKKSA